MSKNLLKSLLFSLLLSTSAVMANPVGDNSDYYVSQAKASTNYIKEAVSDQAEKRKGWHEDYNRNVKDRSQAWRYVSNLAYNNPEAALYFAMTGGHVGFSGVATQAELVDLHRAMATLGSKLQTMNADVMKQYREVGEKVDVAFKQISYLDTVVKELKAENATLRGRVSTLEARVVTLEKELRDERAERKKEREEFERKIGDLNRKNDGLAKQITDLRAETDRKIADLNKRNDELTKRNAELDKFLAAGKSDALLKQEAAKDAAHKSEIKRLEELAAKEKEDRKIERERIERERLLEKEKIMAEQKAEKERIEKERKAEKERMEKEQKLRDEKVAAEQKLRDEKVAAEQKLKEERMIAEQKLKDEKVAAEQKLKEERMIAEQKLKDEKHKIELQVAKLDAKIEYLTEDNTRLQGENTGLKALVQKLQEERIPLIEKIARLGGTMMQ